jgi:hypothetical protein
MVRPVDLSRIAVAALGLAAAAALAQNPERSGAQVARGGEANLTDDELRSATLYMGGSQAARGAAGGAARGTYLVNVVLLDRKTNAPVANALVEARVEPQDPRARPGDVQLVPIGAAGYGAYLKLEPRKGYALLVRIRPPGGAKQVEARFERVL